MTEITRPYSELVWDAAELMPREQLEKTQLVLLKKQLAYVQENSSYYAKVFGEAGFQAADLQSLDDIRKLPLTRKADYVASLETQAPFGSMCAAPQDTLVRVHFSSGTTGKPTPVYWTRNDVNVWADLYARYFYAQGMRKGDIFQCMYNYAWFVAGLGATYAAERIGALVIPASSGDTLRQITTMKEFGPQVLVGTPSFLAYLAQTAQEQGIDPRSLKIRSLATGGGARCVHP